MKEKIKIILRSLRQYKKYAIITPLFMTGEVIMECIMPVIMALFIDKIKVLKVPNDFFHTASGIPAFYLAIILLVMAGLSMLFGILGGVYGSKASCGLAANLREDLYKKLTTFSFENIDKFSASSLVTRMTTDINEVQMAFQMIIRIVVRAPLMIIISSVMAFVAGGWMGFVFFALVPITGFGLFIIIKKAVKIFIKVFKKYDNLNESVQENVAGIRVVKSYVREDFEKGKFAKASDSMTVEFVKAEKIIALNNPLLNTAIHLSNIIVIGLGSYVIYATGHWVESEPGKGDFVGGVLTIGNLSALLTYGVQILMSLMIISMVLAMVAMSFEGVRRIAEVIEEEPTIKNPENPLYKLDDGSVIFNHVDFKYKSEAEKYALSDININIKSGEFIGILGSTGSGKTSVVNLISRLYDITNGQLLVGGHDVKEYDLKTLRDNVAVVLQKNVLFSGTIESNLKWGKEDATEEEMWNACKISQAKEIVESKPEMLQSRVEQGGNNFSGGQKQRLCIARALLKSPKILILDDSTSAVDTKTDAMIRHSLKVDLPEMTKIVIAQRISSIEEADQIIILDNGKIDAIGTHDELLENNIIYQEIYLTQNRIGGKK